MSNLTKCISPTTTSLIKKQNTKLDPKETPMAINEMEISDTMVEEYIKEAQAMIRRWDPKGHSLEKFTPLFHENRARAMEFAECVAKLRTSMHFLIAQRPGSTQLVLANKLMKTAMHRLELEFHRILSSNPNRDLSNPRPATYGPFSSSSSISSREEEKDRADYANPMAELAMADLRMIAEVMIASGYSDECGKIFRTVRRSTVSEQMHCLGFGRTIWRMEGDEEALDRLVDRWIAAVGPAVQMVLRCERVLCDQVFAASDSLKEACMAHVTLDVAGGMFLFPKVMAGSKPRRVSPERIFPVMRLYQAMAEIRPEIESVFSGLALEPIRERAVSTVDELGRTAQAILTEFVSGVRNGPSGRPDPSGGIHPLTCQVMSYVTRLADYSSVLSDILVEEAMGSPSPSPGPTSGVAGWLAWVILVLLCKIDGKARLHGDVGLSYLFLANNVQFVVDKVGTTALKLLLGQEWLSDLQKKVNLFAAKYETVGWGKVLAPLHMGPGIEDSPQAIRENFRRFNSEFEAAYRKQSAWVVPNAKLRGDIKSSIAGKLVPAYREFYGACRGMVMEEKDLQALVRFSPDDLRDYLSGLFGASVGVSGDSSSSSYEPPGLSRCL